ncbi:hypothetical protein [Curtobacterium sp. MCBD17_040]|uniref:hypothetical protein n=1 Tax=Curtobacterium sp. MCBD17_040 TaxID=2175674 RepID=UPI000DAAAF96|nr:hypothetical protein [Curtobacterium sp. MCBD17_040]WIB65459.1 hypothetical protein DEI94_18985 [Curtobacterium sp. MCBD17_040]
MTDPQTSDLDYQAGLHSLHSTLGDTVLRNRTPWTASDYAPSITGQGAKKLAASGIAPLVAIARGYETVDQANAKDFAERHSLGDGRSKRGSQFRSLFHEDNNVLYMPWNPVSRTKQHRDLLAPELSPVVQLRPAMPRYVENKPLKYEFLTGTGTVLDFHPSVTADWVGTVGTYLIAEGMLKGDAALTAQLRKHVPDALLFIGPMDMSREAAMKRLAMLLDSVPVEQRVAIVNIAGVGNWRNNPEWVSLRFKERKVLVAFDGDIASNYNVWKQGKDLFGYIETSKGGEPVLLDLSLAAGGEEAIEDDSHLGIDDYLAKVGDWDDLMSAEQTEFPDMPDVKESTRDGEWQVRNGGTTVDLYTQDKDPSGNDLGTGRWITKYHLGGRVTFFETRRAPSEAEQEGQPFKTGVKDEHYPSFCAVEIGWKDEATNERTFVEVTGPNTLLNYQPVDWVRHGAVIPNALLAHPEWPPADGRNWLAAVKRNEAESQANRVRWTVMGWVPAAESKTQAFIAGDTIIAANDDIRESTLIGVDENALAKASRFGVHDVYTGPNYTDPTGQYNLADDIRTVVSAWITKSPWLSQEIAVTMLALALRPAVPVPTSVASYLVGPPQKGKSWSAKQIMTFWQATRGSWTELPGNAGDTFASTENAVASTMLWVADDLAPTQDRRKADAMESNIGDLIRQVHNKLGKRRMNQDLSAKTVQTPRAEFIVTAENEHSTQSIRERCVIVEFKGLNSEHMAEAERIGTEETTASRITAAYLRWFIARGEELGWAEMIDEIKDDRREAIVKTKGILGTFDIKVGDVTRPSEIVGDLSAGLVYFAQFCEDLGLTDIAEQITWAEDGWLYGLAKQVSYAHLDKADAAPGAVLLDAIRSLLAAGSAHIQNIDDPSRPPIVDGEDQKQLNVLLGWQADSQGDFRPRGKSIGNMSKRRDPATGQDVPVIYLANHDAFNEAQRQYSKRIPHGASSTTYWKNVWDLDLIHPLFRGRRPAKGVTVQYRIGKTDNRPYGIPVGLDALFPEDATPEED